MIKLCTDLSRQIICDHSLVSLPGSLHHCEEHTHTHPPSRFHTSTESEWGGGRTEEEERRGGSSCMMLGRAGAPLVEGEGLGWGKGRGFSTLPRSTPSIVCVRVCGCYFHNFFFINSFSFISILLLKYLRGKTHTYVYVRILPVRLYQSWPRNIPWPCYQC